MTRALLFALLAACSSAPAAVDLGAPPDAGAGDLLVVAIRLPDLARGADLAPAADLARVAPDLAQLPDLAMPPDLAPPRDLEPAADLAPACNGQGLGGTQQHCCPGLTCWQGDGVQRDCLVNREAAGGPDYRCIDRRAGCSGAYAGSCCALDGSPVFNIYGYCDPVYQPGNVQSTFCHSSGCG